MSVLFCNDFCSLSFPRKIHVDERKTSERARVTYKRNERACVRAASKRETAHSLNLNMFYMKISWGIFI